MTFSELVGKEIRCLIGLWVLLMKNSNGQMLSKRNGSLG